MRSIDYSIAPEGSVDRVAIERLLANGIVDLGYLFDGLAQVHEYCDKISDRARFIQAHIDGKLAGFAAVYCNDLTSRAAFLTMIYVSAECRNLGIAKALLQMALEDAKNLGFARFNSRVALNNGASLALHRSLGFQVEHQVGDEANLSLAL